MSAPFPPPAWTPRLAPTWLLLPVLAAAATDSPACRELATQFRTQTRGANLDIDDHYACEFERQALEYRCTLSHRVPGATATTTRQVYRFASIDDLLEEVRVVPPLRRARELRYSGPAAGRIGYAYDAQHRLVRETAPAETVAYTAWDEHGRPTAGHSRAGAVDTTLRIEYHGRTATITKQSRFGSIVCQMTYDASGNPQSNRCSGRPAPPTSAQTTVSRTIRVCRDG